MPQMSTPTSTFNETPKCLVNQSIFPTSCTLPTSAPTPTPSPSSGSGSSEVNFQIIVWILLSLAINSMAQPSGRIIPSVPSRFRLYLCSSPIICIADAISLIVQVVATVAYLRISPRTAILVLVTARSEEMRNKTRIPDSAGHNYLSTVWPRWLFFIIGAIPASIKLMSLSGIPWSQTWGMLFVASFLVIEIFTYIAHHALFGDFSMDSSGTVALKMRRNFFKEAPVLEPLLKSVYLSLFMVALPHVFLTKYSPLLPKICRLCGKLKTISGTFFGIALCLHLGLLMWAVGTVWVMANVAIRAKFIHCTISKDTAATLLDSVTGILESSQEISRSQNISMPTVLTDVLSELKQFNVHDCPMGLPFALNLLELVKAGQTDTKQKRRWTNVIASFKDRFSQSCGVPLPYHAVSMAIDIFLACSSLPSLVQFSLCLVPRKWLGRQSTRWRDWAVLLHFRSAISWIVWGFIPIHHNGLFISRFKIVKFGWQVFAWLGIYFYGFHQCVSWACSKSQLAGMVLLVPSKDKEEVEESKPLLETAEAGDGTSAPESFTGDSYEMETLNLPNAVDEEETVNEREPVDGQETANQLVTANEPDTVHAQETAEAQERIYEQDTDHGQDAAYEQDIVHEQEAANGQNIIYHQEATHDQETVVEQDTVIEQDAVNAKDSESSDVEETMPDLEVGRRTDSNESQGKAQESDDAGLDDAFEEVFRSFYLWFFVTNVLVCVLWYGFKYDSVGTSDPSWTQVFG